MTGIAPARQRARPPVHRLWVRLTHWLFSGSVIVLMISGVTILMAHPRLYWGTAGNDLTPPLIQLPLGPNAHGAPWSPSTPFFAAADGPRTANRLAEPWNENSWARSLHFLAAWLFLLGLAIYLAAGALTGHLRRNILPRADELGAGSLWTDIKAHLRRRAEVAPPGPPYGTLQKLAYGALAFVVLPLMVLTGLTLSPAISADHQGLLDLFGGTQSARTIHFFAFSAVALFLLVHLVMVLLTKPLRQLRAMTWGR